jgi:hypothetical protein
VTDLAFDMNLGKKKKKRDEKQTCDESANFKTWPKSQRDEKVGVIKNTCDQSAGYQARRWNLILNVESVSL